MKAIIYTIIGLIIFLLIYVVMEIYKIEILQPLLPLLIDHLNILTNSIQQKLGTNINPLYFNAIFLSGLLAIFLAISWKLKKKI